MKTESIENILKKLEKPDFKFTFKKEHFFNNNLINDMNLFEVLQKLNKLQ